MRRYYDRRAREYDEWWLGQGQHADEHRPGWHEEVATLVELLARLCPTRTLDVACGTGFLTQHLRGDVTALDQSSEMVRVAQQRMPAARVVRGEAVPIPFADASFERLFTANFYGHLLPDERLRFLAEAQRVAGETIVLDAARRDDVPAEQQQTRRLNDGSEHQVYKRYFTADELADELGCGDVLHVGHWFVVVRARAVTLARPPMR